MVSKQTFIQMEFSLRETKKDVQKNFVQNNCGPKQCWVQKNLGPKKYLLKKILLLRKFGLK